MTELSDYTQNKPVPDIHIEGTWQNKKMYDKYMLSVINMVIMCEFHHTSTEKEGAIQQIVQTSIPVSTNQANPII